MTPPASTFDARDPYARVASWYEPLLGWPLRSMREAVVALCREAVVGRMVDLCCGTGRQLRCCVLPGYVPTVRMSPLPCFRRGKGETSSGRMGEHCPLRTMRSTCLSSLSRCTRWTVKWLMPCYAKRCGSPRRCCLRSTAWPSATSTCPLRCSYMYLNASRAGRITATSGRSCVPVVWRG